MNINSVVHFEVPFDDIERAKAFYSKVFGWQIADWPIKDGTTYSGAMTGKVGEDGKHVKKGVIGGGFVPRAQVKAPIIMLDVENAEEAVQRVTEAGGEKVSQHEYMGIGLAVYVKDSEGNVIGLWQAAEGHKDAMEGENDS